MYYCKKTVIMELKNCRPLTTHPETFPSPLHLISWLPTHPKSGRAPLVGSSIPDLRLELPLCILHKQTELKATY